MRLRFRSFPLALFLLLAPVPEVSAQSPDCPPSGDAAGADCFTVSVGTGAADRLTPVDPAPDPRLPPAGVDGAVSHRLIDVDDLLQELEEQGRGGGSAPGEGAPTDITGEIERAVAPPGGHPRGTSVTVAYETEDFIFAGLPVVVDVSGDWGSWRVECDLTFVFQRSGTGEGAFSVKMGVWGGVMDAAYDYTLDTGFVSVTNYVPSPLGNEPAPFVSGDFFVNEDCGFGPTSVPDAMTPGLIAAVQRQQELCMEAYVNLGLDIFRILLQEDDPQPPGECIVLGAMSASYAEAIGLSLDRVQMMQRCLPDVAAALGDERLMDGSCAADLRAFAADVEAGLGICPLEGMNGGALRIFDPNPYAFKAIYTATHTRWDCKSYSVTAYINGTADFELLARLPEPDLCLVVEPEDPAFHLFFTDRVEEARPLDGYFRLRSGTGAEVPVTVTQVMDGHLRVAPNAPLEPGLRYDLAMKVGEDGIESVAGAPVANPEDFPAPGVSLPMEPGWMPVTQFAASPIARDPAVGEAARFEAGVYQVVRDADLLIDRPTAIRVWYDWKPPGQNPTAHLTAFCLKTEVHETGAPDALLFPPHEAEVRLPALYDAEDRRMGRDTQNIFGWRPSARIDSVTVALEPRVWWHDLPEGAPEDPPRLTLDQPVAFLPDEPATLDYVIGILELGDYADRGWQGDMPAIRAMFEASRLSSWQQFPVGHINLRWTGGVDLVDLGIVSAHENRDIERQALPEVASDPASSDLLNLAAQAFARAHCGATHQVCLLLTPSFNRSHQDITEPGFRGARISGAILGADRERLGGTVSLAADGIGVTHEVGHSFGLVHMPLRVDGNDDFVGYDQDGGIFPGIDGIRMAPSGLSGNIKSSETGNSETRHHLAPLMFPRIMGEDAQFILVANYQIITRSIYGAGGPGERFGPERSGLGRFERSTYADIRNELTRSQATFNEPAGGNSESVVLPLSLGRAEEGSTVEGIALGLSFVTEGVTEGDTARPAFAHSLRAEAAVPLDNLTESAGPRFTLTLHARGEAILARDLTLRPTEALADRTGAGIVTDLDLFLPLDPASRDRIDRITLSDAGGRVLFDHALPELPDRVEQTLLPDGTLLFNWDRAAAYIPAPAAVISVTPQGSETAIPAGIARNLWKLDPDALGISGPATVTLRFDTGLQSREFTLPVTLAPRLISQLAMIAGDGPRPDIVIAFNRPLGPDLPAFTLQGAGADPIPATPLALGDRLVLVPTSDMAPCGRWRIVADGPLRDADGQGLSGRAEWTVDRDGPGCGTAAATPRADATLSAGGRAQDLTGSATLGPEGAILLDLGALAVRIEAPDPGIHGLIAVAPGATRRDLILRFGPGGSGQGELVLETAPGGTSARFTATWDGRELTGTFSLAE